MHFYNANLMGILNGKRGIVTGVVNHRSLAWAIAKLFITEGAEVGLTYYGEGKWVKRLAEKNNISFLKECDMTKDSDVQNVINEFTSDNSKIDFVVHAIAYADGEELKGGVINTSMDGFNKALDTSVYSLINLCHHAKPYLSDNASIISLSYLGSERVCVGYNLMGIAKAALETTAKYLAADLGPQGVRVNVISAGPVRTLAGYGLPNFSEMLDQRAKLSPLRTGINHEDVANAALYYVSDMSTAVTGDKMYVDAGYNIMGSWSEVS